MSVLIHGMEKPNNCHECEIVDILPTCPCRKMADEDFWNNVSLAVEGHKDCPLVEVQPHGRLVDADALADNWYYASAALRPDDVKKVVALDDIDRAPTIIEAEV